MKIVVVMLLAVVAAWMLFALVLPLVAGGLAWIVLVILPLVLTVAGLVSCARSNKTIPLKILWIIVMLLAPFLGPLLWFFWGKKHT